MMVSFSKEFSPFPKVIYVNYNAFVTVLPKANFRGYYYLLNSYYTKCDL